MKKSEEIIKKVIELKGKGNQEVLDAFMDGFATGSNFECGDNTNFNNLLFWGKLHKTAYPETT